MDVYLPKPEPVTAIQFTDWFAAVKIMELVGPLAIGGCYYVPAGWAHHLRDGIDKPSDQPAFLVFITPQGTNNRIDLGYWITIDANDRVVMHEDEEFKTNYEKATVDGS